ncbi:MAG: hypothetical protein JW395_0860 [Nitrospira sp.]|nr:hypothetical protein [Nitrospira sp.]
MKRSSILFNLLGAVGLVGLLSGCGSGGGGATTGTASGSSAASGTITGFGSVIVNGKKFETNGASVMVDGQPVLSCTVNSVEQCGLKEGMTVKVSGTFSGSSHRASTITQEDTLEGPIQAKDPAKSTLTILGQTVVVEEDTTKFDDTVPATTFASLVVGNVVEVSGFVKSDGTIVASFIEQKARVGVCSPVCEVKGTIKGHDVVLATFQIGGLTVTYDNNTIIGDMPVLSGSNWDGFFVEVKGANFSVNAGVPTLVATKVEPENEGVGNDMDEFEVEGFVAQAGTPKGNIIEFKIGTTPVKTTASTEFRGGTVDEIVDGAKMSAEGRFDGPTLIAKHVKFHASVKLEGNIDEISLDGKTFMIVGLPGVKVTVDSQTEGGNTLSVGKHVRVRGRVSGVSTVIATRVEQKSGDPDVDLQGPVQSGVLNPNLTILGMTVNTTGMRFEGLDDGVIIPDAFFGVVKEGTLVKVKGKLVGEVVVWEEAELED